MGPWKRMTHGAGELDNFQTSPAFPSPPRGWEDASVASLDLGLALGPLVGFSQWEAPQGGQRGGGRVRVFLPRLPPICVGLGRVALLSRGLQLPPMDPAPSMFL